MRCISLTWLPLLLITSLAQAEDFDVLPADSAPQTALKRHLQAQAEKAFQQRRERYEALETPEDLQAYQVRIREFFSQAIGELPERTPLNARVLAQRQLDGCRLEKVIFESRPKHYVTAALFLPEGEGPFPGVLIPCGHSATGKAAQQHIAIGLARHGIAALSYDPIGQGERYQLLDADGKTQFGSTTEHTLLAVGSNLVGRSTAGYRIWDGVRALDYLAGREDIDAARLGCTGCSGGGTLTSYLMTFDERIVCAAPSCYVTSFPRLLATIGPQDAEQNLFGQIAFGMDHADYVIARAPRPTLLLAATRDFFDIDGTWHAFREAKRFYTQLGHAERVTLCETDTKHGYPQAQREAMVRWMRRWLLDTDDAVTEGEFATLSPAELHCTPQGQVLLLDGAKSVIDFNVERANELAEARAAWWQPERRRAALDEVRNLAGIRPLADLPQPEVQEFSEKPLSSDGYTTEKLVLDAEGMPLPGLLLVPEKPTGERILFLHEAGKAAAVGEDGPAVELAQQGHVVLALDLRGLGETGGKQDNMWGGNWDAHFLSYLLGKPLVGQQAEDVLRAARFLAQRKGPGKRSSVGVVTVGQTAIPALHAAVLEPRTIRSLTLNGEPTSWSDVVAQKVPKGQLAHTVQGALKVYDLPDLITALGDRVKVGRN